MAWNYGKFTAFALDADTQALLRKGAMEALGGQLGFPQACVIVTQASGDNFPASEQKMALYPVCG